MGSQPLAQHQLKRPDEARAAMNHALELTQTTLPQLDRGGLGPEWVNWLNAQILWREAKALRAGQPAPAGGNEALKLWDTESWQEVLTLEGQGSRFSPVKFSPDGHVIGAMNVAGAIVGGDQRGGKDNTRFRSLATKQSQPPEIYEPIQILLSAL
jgi:hypothetical protein